LERAVLPQRLRSCLKGVQAGTHVYTCGPGGFMDCVVSAASETLQQSAIHLERFHPERPSSNNAKAEFTVVLGRSGASFIVPPCESIISVLASHGFACRSSCQEGVCGTCLTGVLEGTPEHRDSYLTAEERLHGDEMCICVSRSRTPRIVLDL
jgi:ferredoxin